MSDELREVTTAEAEQIYLQPEFLDKIAERIVGTQEAPIDVAADLSGVVPEWEGPLIDPLTLAMWERGIARGDGNEPDEDYVWRKDGI